MEGAVDEAGVAHDEASDAATLRGQAQREVAQRRRNERVAGWQAAEHSRAQSEICPSMLEGGGVCEEKIWCYGIDVTVDAGHSNRAVASAAVAFGQTKIELRKRRVGGIRQQRDDNANDERKRHAPGFLNGRSEARAVNVSRVK